MGMHEDLNRGCFHRQIRLPLWGEVFSRPTTCPLLKRRLQQRIFDHVALHLSRNNALQSCWIIRQIRNIRCRTRQPFINRAQSGSLRCSLPIRALRADALSVLIHTFHCRQNNVIECHRRIQRRFRTEVLHPSVHSGCATPIFRSDFRFRRPQHNPRRHNTANYLSRKLTNPASIFALIPAETVRRNPQRQRRPRRPQPMLGLQPVKHRRRAQPGLVQLNRLTAELVAELVTHSRPSRPKWSNQMSAVPGGKSTWRVRTLEFASSGWGATCVYKGGPTIAPPAYFGVKIGCPANFMKGK